METRKLVDSYQRFGETWCPVLGHAARPKLSLAALLQAPSCPFGIDHIVTYSETLAFFFHLVLPLRGEESFA
jgi:hypothetical protein